MSFLVYFHLAGDERVDLSATCIFTFVRLLFKSWSESVEFLGISI